MNYAFDANGVSYRASQFKSSAEAHSRKYFDDCGIPVTPVISDSKTPHFRYFNDTGSGGSGNGMTLLHKIAQQRMQYCFANSDKFFISFWEYYDEPGDSKHFRYRKIDLKKFYTKPELEGTVKNRRADILLHPLDEKFPPLLVEIAVSHECEQNKINEGFPIIEVRIKKYQDLTHLINKFGIKECAFSKKKPKVRFFNFREKQENFPWNSSN